MLMTKTCLWLLLVLVILPLLTSAMPSNAEIQKLIHGANVKNGKKKKTQCSVCETIVEQTVNRLQGPVNETESELSPNSWKDDEAVNKVLEGLQNPCVNISWPPNLPPGAYLEGCNHWIDRLIKLHETDKYHVRMAFMNQVVKATAKKKGDRILDMKDIYNKVCIIKTKVCKKGRAMVKTPPHALPPMQSVTAGEQVHGILHPQSITPIQSSDGAPVVITPTIASEITGADAITLAKTHATQRASKNGDELEKRRRKTEEQANLSKIAKDANRFANQGGFEKQAERFGDVEIGKKYETQCSVCKGVTKQITKTLVEHLKAGAKHPISQSLGEICNLNSRRFNFNEQTPGTQLMACHRWVEAWDEEDMMENMMIREAAKFTKGGEHQALDPDAMANEACHVRTDVCVKAANEKKKSDDDKAISSALSDHIVAERGVSGTAAVAEATEIAENYGDEAEYYSNDAQTDDKQEL